MDHFVDRFVRDRRLADRHILNAPLRVRIRGAATPEQNVDSENLSTRGILFATNSPFKVGTMVDLLLKMPQEITGVPAMEWLCTGHVVRVEPISSPRGATGVGVQFDCYQVSGKI